MRTALSIRLSAQLEHDARQRAQRLGVSLNALLCVALDAYLRTDSRVAGVDGLAGPGGASAPPPVAPTAKQRYDAQQAQRRAQRRGG